MPLTLTLKLALMNLVCLTLFSLSLAAETPIQTYAASLKGHEFVMRANTELFGTPGRGRDGREIRESDVTLSSENVIIGTSSDWVGKYFVSQQPYRIRDVKYDSSKDRLQVKAWGKRISRFTLEDEIKIEFPKASQLTREQFDKIFYTIFFRPDESISSFVEENDKKLIEAYLNPDKVLGNLPYADRKKLLDGIRSLSQSPKPELERIGDGIYIPAQLFGDGSEYNDIKVSRNQRLASTIEAQIPALKTAAEKAKGLPAIAGIRFRWIVFHRDFLNDPNGGVSEKIEMATSLSVLNDFAAGNLSGFELTQKSILRVDGTKVTLTSYEPIGAR
jgi:hypothetical protein